MIKDIQELNFPSYATMSAATCPQPDMGEWVITSQIRIDGEIAPDFSYDWEVVFQGHKYIQPLRKPQGSKDNEKFSSVINLTFQHWAIWQLKRFPFVTMQPIDSGTAVADEEVADVSLNLGDFSELFAQVLAYYYGDKITLQLNPEWQYKEEAEVISISHTKVWNVLIEVFHKQFGVRWAIEPNGSYDKYVIKVGYPTTEQSHIFEYSFEGGLMKVERQVQSEEICNILKGRGGEKNLPLRYFKNTDPNNPDFAPDPDWIEELANIYFSRLMPATFRSYVQGWKAAHISKYPGYTAVGESNAYSPWAYRKGFTDTKFHPVEFVADEITINPEVGDRNIEILPGYAPAVKKGSSLDKYGPILNSLDDNDEIFPTIQGVVVNPYGRIDQTVAVEPITSDDIAESAESDAQITTFRQPWPEITEKVAKNSRKTIVLTGDWFSVPTGKTANFDEGGKSVVLTKDTLRIWYDFKTGKWYIGLQEVAVGYENVVIEETSVVLENTTGQIVSASGIPSGTYRYKVTCKVYNTATEDYNVTVSLENPTLTDATLDEKWSNVWHIWVKNIWQTSKQSGETDKEYAERVWRPILGDREGNEAKVLFTSGALAISDDYEFTIVATPEYDTSKTLDGVQSHWKITLAKSDADLESLGVYLPSTKRQAIAGDYFVFLGIDPQFYYTDWAERRVDDNKKDVLGDKKDIKPTWVVQTDRVRLNGEGKPNALIRQLHPGDTLRLADKRFIEGDYETLYLSSLTYTYREPTKEDAALNPDVEIVLSDRYEVSANVVSTLQGEVSALAKQVGSISNIEQIVRMIGDKLYLRKDGLPDRSMSPTEFASLLTSLGFRSGMVGGAGWGIYKDANGNWVIEADRFMARQDLEVNNLIINQVLGKGGTEVDCAAFMEITRVEELANGYKCYFDQHEGTVANLFHVDDVAWNNRYTPENADLKFYRRRVTEVGADYVVLTKPLNGSARPTDWPDSGVNGVGIPTEGDVIVHRGNYTDANRQYIKVRDVVGGGYERYIEGLDSVTAEGVEYYFVGRQIGDTPRWFVGYRDIDEETGEDNGSYIEYKDRKLKLNNVSLSITSTIGNQTLSEYFSDLIPEIPEIPQDQDGYLREALKQASTTAGGLFLSSYISLGSVVNGVRTEKAGMNGIWKTDKSPFLWGGGSMVDRFFDADGNPRTNPLATDFAKAMIRMDGSAYLGGGAHVFNEDGSGFLANGNITWDASGIPTIGSNVIIKISENETLNTALSNLTTHRIGVDNLFVVVENNTARTEHDLSWAAITENQSKILGIKAKYGFFSDEWVSARGLNPDGSGSGGGLIQNVYGWGNIGDSFSNSTLTDTFNAYTIKKIYSDLNSRIDNLPTTSVNPYALTIQRNGTTLGTYDGSSAKTINISDVASASTLSSHTGNGTIHITANERTLWNNTATNLSAILGADSDTVINKWEEVVAFLDTYTEADTLAGLLSNKADKTTKISAGTGLSGGGTLASDRTLSLATSGVTAGTYTKLTVDAYGRATSGASLVASDIPTLAISKISGLQTALNSKLDASVFNELFEKVNIGTASAPVYAIKAKFGFYTEQFISARGSNPAGGSGSGFGLLRTWTDPAGYADDAFSAQVVWDKINSLPTTSVNPYALTIQKNGTTIDSYNGSSAKTVNITVGWSDTASGRPSWIGSSKPSYSFSEIGSKPTTLSGYGITDAKIAGGVITLGSNTITPITSLAGYATQSWVEGKGYLTSSALSNYVTLDTAQTISGAKTFKSQVAIVNDYPIKVTMPVAIPTNSGWARGLFAVKNKADETIVTFGVLGNKDAMSYAYIGRNAYNSDENLRIYPNGKATAKSFATYNGTSSQFLKADGSVDSNSYATTSALGNYLPLAGGTLTGTLNLATGYGMSDASGNGLLAYKPTTWSGVTNTQWGVGALDIQGIIRSSNSSLLHYRHGVGAVTIWDSYNDGSGSGLDADLLDGYHNGEVTAADMTVHLLTANTDLNNLITPGRYGSNGTSICSSLVNNPSTTTHGEIIIDVVNNGSANGAQFVFKKSSNTWEYWLRSVTNNNSFSSWKRFAFTDSNVASATKLADNTSYKAWGQEFFVDGKPKTVSGDMTGVGSITASGTIKSTGTRGFLNETATGVWAYMRLNSNNYMWDVAVKDTDLSGALQIRHNGANANRVVITTGGNVGIKKSDPSCALDVNGTAKATQLIIGSTSAVAHIAFSRGNYNYLTAPASSSIAFVTNGKSVSDSNSDLIISANEVKAGTTNLVTLGNSTRRWANTYSVLGNFSGLITASAGIQIGGCVITWDATNKGLKFSKGIYSEEFVSARGVNPNGGASGGSAYNRLDSWGDYVSGNGDVLSADLGHDLYVNKLNKYTSAGVLEVAQYIDFHTISNGVIGTEDYTVRLNAGTASTARAFTFPTTGGTLATEAFVTGKGYLTGITKAQVEAVLTGNITSHTHSQYLTSHQALDHVTPTELTNQSLAIKDTTTKVYYAGGGNSVSDKPTGVDAFGMLTLRTAGGYYGHILMSSNNATGLYWRTATNPSGNWRTILDSSNYTSIVSKIGTATVGGTSKPIYLNAGAPTALSATVGSASKPVYLNGGTITACTNSIPTNTNQLTNGAGFITASALNSYLPLAGGTLTGVLATIEDEYTDSYDSGAINLNNSDIFKVNSIKFADLCDSAAEGLQWYRDATHVDSLWVKSGVIYFTPNRVWGATATDYVVLHSNNYTSYVAKVGTATKGSASLPIYLNAGTPTACTASSIFSVLTMSGNNLSVTVAGQNRTLTVGYATKAAQLNTARTLWGKSFNGTANISGDMTGVGSVYASGSLYFDTTAVSEDMSATTANPKIVFSDTGEQKVGIVYTDYDAYRAGKGLAVMDVDGIDPDVWFEVKGTIIGTTGIYSDGYVSARGQNTSDVRLKTEIKDFNATEIIRRLQPKTFKWNALAKSKFEVFRTDEVQYGLIAQETIKTDPWLVDRNMFKDGLWGVHYENLIPVLLQAQREVTFTVDDLLVRVKKLENENKELKRKIEFLERR